MPAICPGNPHMPHLCALSFVVIAVYCASDGNPVGIQSKCEELVLARSGHKVPIEALVNRP